MPGARTLYEILNVSPDAEPVVVEAAYRALMKKYHPDQGGVPAPEAPSAASINHAYSILRDGERRTQYDHLEWARQQNLQLAQYHPPLPRQPRLFGWGGWIVALVLAAVVLLMARDRDDLAVVTAPGSELATDANPPASQLTGETKALPSFLKTNAPEREVEIMRNAEIASARARAVQAEIRGYADASAKPRWSPPRKQKLRKVRRPARKQVRRNRDFLERKGYIY
jgi:curved DNA-binding protein CbpA